MEMIPYYSLCKMSLWIFFWRRDSFLAQPLYCLAKLPVMRKKWLMLNVYMNWIFTYETHIVRIRGPQPQIECLMVWSGADVIIEIKCTVNAMHLNHPKTISPNSWSMEKFYSMKLVPKGWGPLVYMSQNIP